jgi:predicted RNase H-like HicB family nuclease
MRRDTISFMERFTFPVIVEQDTDGFYVTCPLLQGCYSQGVTYEEAMKNIKDAIRLHLEDRRANHESVPVQKLLSLSTVEVLI